MMKRKVTAASIVLLIILMIFTFVSRSIYNYNLPLVTAVKVTMGSITLTADAIGTLDYRGASELRAAGAWIIGDVYVKDGQRVSDGDVLCTFDTRASDINIQTLELNVLKAQNELGKQEQYATASRQEAPSAQFDDYVYQQAITSAKTALTRKQEDLVEAQAALADAAQTGLPASVVISVQRCEQDLQDAEDALAKARAVLRQTQAEQKDASIIQIVQAAVDEAQKDVTSAQQVLQDAKLSEQNAQDILSSNAKTAQRAVIIAQQAVDDAQASLDTANTDLARALDAYDKNLNLTRRQLTAEQAEAIAALDIAQAQLDLAVSQAPPPGGLVAPCDGEVFGMSYRPGDTTQPGDIIVAVIPDSAAPRLTFTLATDVGTNYRPGSSVQATLEVMNEDGTHMRETVKGVTISGILKGDVWTLESLLMKTTNRPIAGQDVQLEVTEKVPGDSGYGIVVPIGSMFDDGNGGKCVFIIDTRPGLFGLESYVTQQSVTVVADNGKYVLVTGGISHGQMLANTPSRTIHTETAVWIRDN